MANIAITHAGYLCRPHKYMIDYIGTFKGKVTVEVALQVQACTSVLCG